MLKKKTPRDIYISHLKQEIKRLERIIDGFQYQWIKWETIKYYEEKLKETIEKLEEYST